MRAILNKKSQKPFQVNLLGVTYNTYNYGVRVLLSSAVDGLSGMKRNLKIRILDYGHDPVTWVEKTQTGDKDLSLINLRFSWKLHLPNNILIVLLIAILGRMIPSSKWRERLWKKNPWLRRILEANINLSLAGGDSFSDIYGMERLVYVLFPQILVILLGRRLILLPQTYGPFKKKISRILARYIFQRAISIYSRDLEGMNLIKKLLGRDDPKLRFIPDLGFALKPEPFDQNTMLQILEAKQGSVLVGLNISRLLYMGGYTENNMFGLKEEYPKLINVLLDFLVKEVQCKVLLIPHVYGGSDSMESEFMLCRRLLPDFSHKFPGRIRFIDKTFSHRQIKSIIGQCDLMIGSRMHACIAAVSQCVPTLCLAYSDKFNGVMSSVSADINVVDLRDSSIQDTIEATRSLFHRRHEVQQELHKKMPDVLDSCATLFHSETLF